MSVFFGAPNSTPVVDATTYVRNNVMYWLISEIYDTFMNSKCQDKRLPDGKRFWIKSLNCFCYRYPRIQDTMSESRSRHQVYCHRREKIFRDINLSRVFLGVSVRVYWTYGKNNGEQLSDDERKIRKPRVHVRHKRGVERNCWEWQEVSCLCVEKRHTPVRFLVFIGIFVINSIVT